MGTEARKWDPWSIISILFRINLIFKCKGYTYSVFNLVFANNTASMKIWDDLGFERIGRVKKAARLANSEELVDAVIYGKDLV